MHRNTTIFVVILGIFAAIVTGVNLARIGTKDSSKVENQVVVPTNIPTPTLEALVKYADEVCNYAFYLPASKIYTAISSGGGTISDPNNPDQTTSLSCVRTKTKLTNPDLFENLFIGTIAAYLVTPQAETTSSAILNRTLIFNHPYTNREIRIFGEKNIITELANTMQFLNPATN